MLYMFADNEITVYNNKKSDPTVSSGTTFLPFPTAILRWPSTASSFSLSNFPLTPLQSGFYFQCFTALTPLAIIMIFFRIKSSSTEVLDISSLAAETIWTSPHLFTFFPNYG